MTRVLKSILILLALFLCGCAAKLLPVPPVPPPNPIALQSGQIGFRISPAGAGSIPRLLNKRLSGVAMMWYVHMQNASAETVNVYPSLVIGQTAHLEPFDYPSMLLLIGDAQTYSLLARAGRLGTEGAKITPYLLQRLSKYISASWIEAAMGMIYFLPEAVSYMKQIEKPVSQSFDSLAWKDPIALPPGATATEHLFTAAWSGVKEYQFVVSVRDMPIERTAK